MKSVFTYQELRNPNEDSGFLLLLTYNLWEQNHKKVLQKHQLTHTQFAVLASIYWLSLHNDSPITQIILAKHIKTNPMNISPTLKGLEKRDLVARPPHPVDVRAKMITLTPKGDELIQKAVITVQHAEKRFFEALGKNNTRFKNYLIKIIISNS
ncbi:MAG: MarR family transcriptional regulator [Dysgonamonadaceae bacterium]|jgi:DNA-binding MarR family transcriptional regulator|nr:MarR family transcriptional regulator [Dysgonamonadaceae bacterium]